MDPFITSSKSLSSLLLEKLLSEVWSPAFPQSAMLIANPPPITILPPGMQTNFMPIVERELRAAARRNSTYYLRWSAATVGIAGSFIWLVSLPLGGGATRFFDSLFAFQTACAFGFALLAGVFLSSDCISEEKREGTLGLLFLTNLRAGGIVLGKFAGASLNAACVLLALLPITAVPLLFGGVTVGEFWRMALALANTLFFSLAVGLAVSAFVTNYSRGLLGTLGLLAGFGAGLPALGWFAPKLGLPAIGPVLAYVSPLLAIYCARDANYTPAPLQFWSSLIVSHAFGWLCLKTASIGLRRSWRDKRAAKEMPSRAPKRPIASAAPKRRRSTREIAFDPVVYLVGDMPLLRWTVWLVVLASGALLCLGRFWPLLTVPHLLSAKACAFLLKILVAFQACRFFVECRRNGALELLLCTPLRNKDLTAAQWRALVRVFFLPLVIFVLLVWFTAPSLANGAGAPVAGPKVLNQLPAFETGYLGTLFLSIGLAADIMAVGWFGMWLALTVKRPSLAPGLTILLVLILPAMLSCFDLVADMLFISWGTTRFQEEFRWIVATAPDNRSTA